MDCWIDLYLGLFSFSSSSPSFGNVVVSFVDKSFFDSFVVVVVVVISVIYYCHCGCDYMIKNQLERRQYINTKTKDSLNRCVCVCVCVYVCV
jgi:hypothetical protein